MNTLNKSVLIGLLGMLSISFASYAQEGEISFGLFGNIVGSSGKPSNDVLGIGLIGNYQLKDKWFIDIELIHSEADFERPWKTLGIVQDETTEKTIDAVYTSNLLMAQIGQNMSSGSSSFDYYWSAGLGFNSMDVETVSGPVLGGGTFNITTDTRTETIIGGKLGIKQHLSDNWSMNYALRADYHLADWTVTDTISNTTTKIEDYTTYGMLIGAQMKF